MKKTSYICFLSSDLPETPASKKAKGKLKPAARKVIAPAIAQRLAVLKAKKEELALVKEALKLKLAAVDAELVKTLEEMKDLEETAEQLGLA